VADFSLARSTSISDPSSGSSQQQQPTTESSPPTPTLGDAVLHRGCSPVWLSAPQKVRASDADSWTRGSLVFESTSPR
jgi:hypothetical protein